jgi:drug/metabolite transporter (DMT)-like permease
MDKQLFRGILLVTLGACSYGILATFVKMAYLQGYTTAEVTTAQFSTGLLILGLLNLFQGKDRRAVASSAQKQGRASAVYKLILAGSSLGLTSTFYYFSVRSIPVSIAIVLLMQSVWMGVFLEALLHRQWPSPVKWIACISIWAGTLLATNVFYAWHELNITGLAWGILAAAAFTASMYSSGRIAQHIPALKRSLLLLCGGTIVVLLVSFPQLILKFDYTVFWRSGLLLAVFGTVLPPLLFTSGMPLTGVGIGTIIASMEIPVSVLMAHFLLHERVNGYQWLGIAIILSAVAMMNLRLKRSGSPGLLTKG